MKFDYGTWIAVGAVLFFYLRLIILQRQKARQLANSAPQVRKGPRKKTSSPSQDTPVTKVSLFALNIPLTAAGALLVLGGAALAGLPALAAYSAFWWLPVTIGIVLMGLGFH